MGKNQQLKRLSPTSRSQNGAKTFKKCVDPISKPIV